MLHLLIIIIIFFYNCLSLRWGYKLGNTVHNTWVCKDLKEVLFLKKAEECSVHYLSWKSAPPFLTLIQVLDLLGTSAGSFLAMLPDTCFLK